MSRPAFSTPRLNNALRIFFRDALRIALKNPGRIPAFIRTLSWLKKSAAIRAEKKKEGIQVPPIVIFSITQECNLSCNGCYAQALRGNDHEDLSDEKLHSIFQQAEEAGVSFFVIAGGEPFLRQELVECAAAHPRLLFMVFTNGLCIDEDLLQRIRKLKNIIPLVSLEGGEEETDSRRGKGVYSRVRDLMKRMKKTGIFFGASLTLTRSSWESMTKPDFVKDLTAAGCRFFLYLEYTPAVPDTEEQTLTAGQQEKMMARIEKMRKQYPALFITVPGDETAVGGCLAAGRGFIHINAQGDVEPCPFAPFSDVNIKDVSLEKAFCSPLLEELRRHPGELIETTGGCVLWRKREWVRSLLQKKGDSLALEPEKIPQDRPSTE